MDILYYIGVGLVNRECSAGNVFGMFTKKELKRYAHLFDEFRGQADLIWDALPEFIYMGEN